MGRTPCCDKAKVKKGPWSPGEDATLKDHLQKHGNGGNWISLPRKAGLKRCGKSCRLRWLNYLRPNIKRGGFTEEEDHIICTLHGSMGSRWSLIARQLPGRTDNDVKNYWNTTLKKKLLAGEIGAKRSNNNYHCDASDFNNNNHMATSTANDPNLAEFFHGHDTTCSPYLVASSGASPPPLMELISYQQHCDPQRPVGDQTKFPVSDFMEVSNLGASGCNSYGLPSSSLEIPSLPASSSLALENELASWPRNGLGVQEDEISFDFGSESFYELLTHFDSQEKCSEIASCVANSASNY